MYLGLPPLSLSLADDVTSSPTLAREKTPIFSGTVPRRHLIPISYNNNHSDNRINAFHGNGAICIAAVKKVKCFLISNNVVYVVYVVYSNRL